MRDTVRISTNEIEYRERVCVEGERKRERRRGRERRERERAGEREGGREGGLGEAVRAERLHFPRLDPLHGA